MNSTGREKKGQKEHRWREERALTEHQELSLLPRGQCLS